ncbi:MAG: septum formation protein Maf [Elusimicrobia bacterium GWA2_56_46]|nr:MAG: septum formation protein Maf [Elusimicrobia bacterium GWA2_56_46]OGR53787.1 MAG: septum formation protein Maf [Elusimicrobia bacterium GWC2_56_31]HBB68022.1 septum formation protein Maf [Elusimicrobiota bacterium]HBW22639.1 septum formation protein Maf [Elusimicrobiota bacterium]
MTTKLILASQSPRRARLLKEAGIAFTRIPSRIKETTTFKKPELVVKELSYKKALSVALKNPGRPVLGSDTIVFCKGRILNKPKNEADAMRLLRLQNGSWQTVYSGVSLLWLDKAIFLAGFGTSRCKARKLGGAELRMLASKHPDKAGAYAVQDAEDEFIEKIEGRFDTVVGLPMDLVKKFMKKAKIS